MLTHVSTCLEKDFAILPYTLGWNLPINHSHQKMISSPSIHGTMHSNEILDVLFSTNSDKLNLHFLHRQTQSVILKLTVRL